MIDAELVGGSDDDDAGVFANAGEKRVVRDVRVRAQDGAADEMDDTPRSARGLSDPRVGDFLPPVAAATAAGGLALELEVLEP